MYIYQWNTSAWVNIKLRSHMCGTETGGFWHSLSATAGMFTHTRNGHGQICHFLRTKMVWSTQFQNGHGKLGAGPICCGANFAPTPSPLRDRICVNTCNDLCWSQFSARICCAYVRTYLYGCLLPIWWQAITLTNVDLLSVGHSGTN